MLGNFVKRKSSRHIIKDQFLKQTIDIADIAL